MSFNKIIMTYFNKFLATLPQDMTIAELIVVVEKGIEEGRKKTAKTIGASSNLQKYAGARVLLACGGGIMRKIGQYVIPRSLKIKREIEQGLALLKKNAQHLDQFQNWKMKQLVSRRLKFGPRPFNWDQIKADGWFKSKFPYQAIFYDQMNAEFHKGAIHKVCRANIAIKVEHGSSPPSFFRVPKELVLYVWQDKTPEVRGLEWREVLFDDRGDEVIMDSVRKRTGESWNWRYGDW